MKSVPVWTTCILHHGSTQATDLSDTTSLDYFAELDYLYSHNLSENHSRLFVFWLITN